MAWEGAKAKTARERRRLDLISGRAQAGGGGYILSHTMSQPLMGQRSDALISLIDGLEAHNSPQREDDQENGGEGEELE